MNLDIWFCLDSHLAPVKESHYRARGRARDGKCLITGLQTQTYSRLTVAHIFPRAHDAEVSEFVFTAFLTSAITVDTQRVPRQNHRYCGRRRRGRLDKDGLYAKCDHSKRFTRRMGQLRIRCRSDCELHLLL